MSGLQNACAPLVPVVTRTIGHSVAAQFVVTTKLVRTNWVETNCKALEQVLQATLAESDMLRARPGSLLGL